MPDHLQATRRELELLEGRLRQTAAESADLADALYISFQSTPTDPPDIRSRVAHAYGGNRARAELAGAVAGYLAAIRSGQYGLAGRFGDSPGS